jgi:sugar/nucleoside kinase (ribokinase family)
MVDPTGAGNSYGGGLCVGWAESQDARIAGSYGGISASLLLRSVGYPDMSAALQEQARRLLDRTVNSARRL